MEREPVIQKSDSNLDLGFQVSTVYIDKKNRELSALKLNKWIDNNSFLLFLCWKQWNQIRFHRSFQYNMIQSI